MLQKKVRVGGNLPMTRDRVIRMVTVSNRFSSHVMLEREGSSVNGKSMLGLLSITGLSGRGPTGRLTATRATCASRSTLPSVRWRLSRAYRWRAA